MIPDKKSLGQAFLADPRTRSHVALVVFVGTQRDTREKICGG